MRIFCLTLIIFSNFILVNLASADVIINEVAWMGDAVSANHEWIELYNNGISTVSVEGWLLTGGAKPNIDLKGEIPAESYVVLERTNEESAPGTAFLIYAYSEALVNTGVTLVLKDSVGNEIDKAAVGEDWKGERGDNLTKETAQYTTQGWVTDKPTPGAANGSGRVLPETLVTENLPENTSTYSSNKSSSKSTEAVRLKVVETKLILKTDVQSIAYVNQDVPFNTTISGIDDAAKKQVKYEWNFGDSYTSEEKKPEHSYKYPGTYIVTVYAKYNKAEQVTKHEIKVLPVSFSITKSEGGDLQINNNSPYEVEISGYRLRGGNEIIMPPRTVLAPRSTLTISAERLGQIDTSLIAFYDNQNNLITSNYSELKPLLNKTEILTTAPPKSITKSVVYRNTVGAKSVPNNETFNFITKVEAKELAPEVVEEKPNAAELPPARTPKEVRWPYLVFVGILIFSILGIVLGRKGVSK